MFPSREFRDNLVWFLQLQSIVIKSKVYVICFMWGVGPALPGKTMGKLLNLLILNHIVYRGIVTVTFFAGYLRPNETEYKVLSSASGT